MLHFYSTIDCSYEATILSAAEGEDLQVTFSFSGILFVQKGEAYINFQSGRYPVAQEGQMIFLPRHNSLVLTTLSTFQAVTIQLPEIEMYCHHFFGAEVYKKRVFTDSALRSLPMCNFIHLLATGLHRYVEDKLADPALVKIKSLELFYFISTNYSSDSIASFFAPVLSEEYVFYQFVLDNYRSVKTVRELADKSNYSLSGFEKQFRKIFGIAPYQWIVRKKTEHVFYEISETSKPLKVIAEETGFAGLSQLSDFCRKRLGKSPLAIRMKPENEKKQEDKV